MGRWLKKISMRHKEELTKLTEPGCVGFVSDELDDNGGKIIRLSCDDLLKIHPPIIKKCKLTDILMCTVADNFSAEDYGILGKPDAIYAQASYLKKLGRIK